MSLRSGESRAYAPQTGALGVKDRSELEAKAKKMTNPGFHFQSKDHSERFCLHAGACQEFTGSPWPSKLYQGSGHPLGGRGGPGGPSFPKYQSISASVNHPSIQALTHVTQIFKARVPNSTKSAQLVMQNVFLQCNFTHI